jgi:hypothetical protein
MVKQNTPLNLLSRGDFKKISFLMVCHADEDRHPVVYFSDVGWIPAFAGMTKELGLIIFFRRNDRILELTNSTYEI